jgi:TolA-binding protein
MVKVQLPKVEEKTRDKINLFKSAQKLYKTEKNIKTFEDAVLFAIEEASKVQELESKINELESKIKELDDTIFELNSDIYNLKTGRSTLSEFKEKMKGSNVNCTVSLKYIGTKAVNEERET